MEIKKFIAMRGEAIFEKEFGAALLLADLLSCQQTLDTLGFTQLQPCLDTYSLDFLGHHLKPYVRSSQLHRDRYLSPQSTVFLRYLLILLPPAKLRYLPVEYWKLWDFRIKRNRQILPWNGKEYLSFKQHVGVKGKVSYCLIFFFFLHLPMYLQLTCEEGTEVENARGFIVCV